MDLNDPLGKIWERAQRTFNIFTSLFFPGSDQVYDSLWLFSVDASFFYNMNINSAVKR